MADKLILVTRDELLHPTTYLSWLLGHTPNPTNIVVPEHLIFLLLRKLSPETTFEVKLM
jgi:hypothetical protein